MLEMAMRGAGPDRRAGRDRRARRRRSSPTSARSTSSCWARSRRSRRPRPSWSPACAPGGTAVVPAGEPLLDAHRRDDVTTVTFGPGGDVDALPDGLERRRSRSAHMRRNALAALAAARAVGRRARRARWTSRCRACAASGSSCPDGIVVVNDCYNANPMSMRAALDDLAASASGRRVAVLGDMLELGPDEARFHAEIGAHARDAGRRPARRRRAARRAHGRRLRRA